MDDKDEELIFDFLAAAEETGKRLDTLIKVIPGELQKTFSAEYQRSPWLATLPAEVERLSVAVKSTESAAERADSATAHMERRIKTVRLVACVVAVVMPLAAVGVAYWSLSDLRRQQVRLEQENVDLAVTITTAVQTERRLAEAIASQKNEIRKLSGTAEMLRSETGGLDVVDNGDGLWEIILPVGALFESRPWRNLEGRFVVPYSVSGK